MRRLIKRVDEVDAILAKTGPPGVHLPYVLDERVAALEQVISEVDTTYKMLSVNSQKTVRFSDAVAVNTAEDSECIPSTIADAIEPEFLDSVDAPTPDNNLLKISDATEPPEVLDSEDVPTPDNNLLKISMKTMPLPFDDDDGKQLKCGDVDAHAIGDAKLNELLMMLAQSSAENQTAVKTLADMLAEQIKVVNALAEDSAVIKNSMKEMSVTFKGLSNVFFEEINTSSKRIDKVEKDSMGIGQVEKLVRRQFVEFSKNLDSWIVNAVRRTMDSEKAKAKDHDEDSDPEAKEFLKIIGWR